MKAAFGGLAIALLLASLSAVQPAAAQTDGQEDGQQAPHPAEPADYRMDEYRAPTPATLKGAHVVDTAAAVSLWRDKAAAFIDTMPRDEKPKNLPAGTIWRDRPRDNIPGSVWLANVGYGETSAEMTAYFRDGLTAISGGDRARKLLFYCRTDCWMSWNAAKRALEWGYTDVVWYPDGSDGWDKAGMPLQHASPWRPETAHSQ